MSVTYSSSADGLTAAQLGGFFEGWPEAPDAAEHLALLRGSDAIELALDEAGRVIGFATGVSDHVMTLFVTLVEVLPEHRGRGIGGELVRRLSDRFSHLRYRCLHCDPERVSFYERLGYEVVSGVQMLRFREPS